MNAIKVRKKIHSNDIHIDGLEQYKGKSAEIIILIDETISDDSKMRRDSAFKIIDSYSGKIEKWSRDELYER